MPFDNISLRERHMLESLVSLENHLSDAGGPAKVVMRAHNSHIGDAAATDMAKRGELNVGQLGRERYGRDAILVGFTTDSGTVTAATEWGKPAERKRVRAALPGSFENLFHQRGIERFLLLMKPESRAKEGLRGQLLERGIGVIYRLETERKSNYFKASVSAQFDAIIHVDHTRAVEPLERTAEWETGEPAETFPTGM